MSSTSVESSPSSSSHTQSSERPLIVAAYRYGDPFRKRRVKVPLNISWNEFLGLFYSRLDIGPDAEIEIFDEKGIEIVSVEDLVENDILVVKEKHQKVLPHISRPSTKASPEVENYGPRSLASHPPNPLPSSMAPVTRAATMRLRDQSFNLHEHPLTPMGVPQLAHFIQSNSFGYYFLAEVENMKLLPPHGKFKKTHCIVKVPHCEKTTGNFQTFESEANLLRKISGHKCIISAPVVQILNFSDENLQKFYSTVPHQKQSLLRELFINGVCTEAYVYPLYGVTMATKIKAGLMPDKVLKYAYQLTDIMHYLQQRGVIHQNLLPENIQVMSNDRVIVCNFETAVHTDPTTCLLVVSSNVVAPSNRRGLAPEVISAFTRVETETVDYSTQYPWSFGILSVVMATGQHPLKDYPNAFENGGRVKYRSLNFQAFPDPNQHPPLFCKLVKRALSCDPIRRPTLPQILSIMKKDSRIFCMMTGRKANGATVKSRVGFEYEQRPLSSMKATGETRSGDSYLPFRRHSLREARPASEPPYHLSRRHVREDRYSHSYQEGRHTDHAIANQSHMTSMEESHDLYSRPYGSHMQHIEATGRSLKLGDSFPDPFMPVDTKNPLHSHTPPQPQWFSFDDPREPLSLRTRQSHFESARRAYSFKPGLRRYGSQGAFSDEFVPSKGKNEDSSPKQARSQFQNVSENLQSLRQVKPSYTSESELSQAQEFQYQRLIPSPSNMSSYGRLPTTQKSDQESLIATNSPVYDCNTASHLQEFPASTEELAGEKGTIGYGMEEVSISMQELVSSPQDMETEDLQIEMPVTTTGPTRSAQEYQSDLLADSNDQLQRSQEDTMEVGTMVAEDSPKEPTFSENTDAKGSETPQATVSRRLSYKLATDDERLNSHSSTPRPQTQEVIGSKEAFRVQNDEPEERMEAESSKSVSVALNITNQTKVNIPKGRQGQSADSSQSEQKFDSSVNTQVLREAKKTSVANPTIRSSCSMQEQIPLKLASTRSIGNQPLKPMSASAAESTSKKHFHGDSFISEASVGNANPKPGHYLYSLDTPLLGLPDLALSEEAHCTKTTELKEHLASTETESNEVSMSSQAESDNFPEAIASQFQTTESLSGEDLTPKQVTSDAQEAENQFATPHKRVSHDMHHLSNSDFEDATKSHATSSRLLHFPWSQDKKSFDQIADHSYLLPQAQQHSSRAANVAEAATQIDIGVEPHGPVLPIGPGPISYGPKAHVNIMSPIPEASQEVSSSQTQTNTDRLSSSLTRSTSPEDAFQQRSVSPFRHSAFNDRASTPRSQSTISERGSTPQDSTLIGTSMQPLPEIRAVSPQLEPPSSDTSRSHSTTSGSHSSHSGESSTQATVNTPLHRNVSANKPHQADNDAETQQSAERALSDIMPRERGHTPQSNISAPPRMQHEPPGLSARAQFRGNTISPSHSRISLPLSGATPGQHYKQSQGLMAPRLTDYPRSHRISQDLEMMNLAISGMDSQSQEHGSWTQASARNISGFPRNQGPPNRPNIEASRMFRPINPAYAEYRSVSAGPTLAHNEPYSSEPPRITDSQEAQEAQQLVASGVPGRQMVALPPPQVSVDSYDYLPPYSPPKNKREPSKHQFKTPPLYPEPPPSYEEIFGKPSSHGHQNRLRQHSYSSSRYGGNSAQPELHRTSSQTYHRPISRQSSGQRRLSSLTNLFRRSRSRQSQEASSSFSERDNQLTSESNEHTASWVASYSHTPRPVDVIDFGQDALSMVSTRSSPVYSHAHSQVSRAVSDTTSTRRHPPVPYRNPPPFPSAENIPQLSYEAGATPTIRDINRSRRIMNPALTNITTETAPTRATALQPNYHSYRPSSVTRRHPRPLSAMIPSDFDIAHTNLSLHENTTSQKINTGLPSQSRVLSSTGNISASCFNILSPTEQHNAPENNQSSTTPGRANHLGSVAQSANKSQVQAPYLAQNANANNTNGDTSSPTRVALMTNVVSPTSSSDVNEMGSCRANARQRAITRRAAQAPNPSSSDDETPEQRQRSKLQLRRRRVHNSSVGSQENSHEASQWETAANLSSQPAASRANWDRSIATGGNDDHVTTVTSELPGTIESPHTPTAHEHPLGDVTTTANERNTLVSYGTPTTSYVEGDSATAVTERLPEQRVDPLQLEQTAETTTDLHSESSNPQALLIQGSNKSCGHRCVLQNQQLCCVCSKDQQRPLEIACHICERRSLSEGRDTAGESTDCICHGNKMNASCPVHRTCVSQQQQQLRRGGRNCTVM